MVSVHRAVDAVPEAVPGAAGHRRGVAGGKLPGAPFGTALLQRAARRIPVRPSDRRSRAARWRARHFLLGTDGARRYLAPHLTVQGFFTILERRDVPHAVLRWFDDLPHVEPGEDIDILIADDQLEFVHTLLLPRPLRRDSQPFDVYTVGGLPGSDFAEVPYYPPAFAEELLASVDRVGDLYRVPNPQFHFLSLAYHAVYHKGYASGLRTGVGQHDDRPASDHDYETVLTGLAEQLGRPMTPTLEGLDDLLADQGMRPPMDTLERLRPCNPWITDRFFADLPPVAPEWQGLAVFVVRERAEARTELIAQELNRHGFEVLEVVRLDPGQREAAAHRIRGGNWGRGPWAVGGGGPGSFVIAYDVAPRVDPSDAASHTNLRIAEAKAAVREWLLGGLSEPELYNPLHSSDNPRQSLEYLEALQDAELVTRVREAARQLVRECGMPYPVMRLLAPAAPARRARVALVDHPRHGASVCKVYRPGARRYFERELRARRELSDLPMVPGLLERGDNWVLTPFYSDDGRQVQRRLPFMTAYHTEVQLRPEAVRDLAEFAKALHERGLFILDLTTENIISDPQAGLKVLDLEFLQEYTEPVPSLAECYSFRGIPTAARERYDEPLAVPLLRDGRGNQVFHPAIAGLPVRSFLRPARGTDEFRRTAVQLTWYAYLGVCRLSRSALGGVLRSRWGRRAKNLPAAVRARGRRPW